MKQKGQNLCVRALARLHRVGICSNKYCILDMDSSVYLERKSSFSLYKKETYYLSQIEQHPYSALLNVFSKCHNRQLLYNLLKGAQNHLVEQSPEWSGPWGIIKMTT